MSVWTVGASVIIAALVVGGARAQEGKTPTADSGDTRVVVVEPEFAAGGVKRKLLGRGYRDLWTTPVRLEVLDLRAEDGGLTPVRQVGQAQSVGLALRGPDGRSYTFRSLHKEPERMLPAELRDGLPGYIMRDMTAGTHPAAGVVFAGLAEAAGIPHTTPRLVVMPDDPALGQFRKTFADHVGTFEEYPLAGKDGSPGFMGATEIISSTGMWERWLEGPSDRLDSRAYLRSRVLELLVDNHDRHRGQWRWMKVPGHDAWQPIGEDPDFVLMRRDGLVMTTLRSRQPNLLVFSREFPRRLDGALLNGAEMDRWVLSDLDAQEVESVAGEVQARLTNDVLERALRRMPPEWYAIDGARTLSALEDRRTGLVDYLLRVYRYHARNVDIHATNRDERVTVSRAADDSLVVSIALAEGADGPYYERRFVSAETQEIRIFLYGGDDRVERRGPAGGPITVRVIAGGGTDRVDDSKSGGTEAWRDAGTLQVDRGAGTSVRETPWRNPAPVKDAPWVEPRSWGHWSVPAPMFGWAPDVALYLGYGFTRTSYGFRTTPNKSEQTLQGALATGDLAARVEYFGLFRRPAGGVGYQVAAYASGLESFNYFGPGNDSPRVADRNVYKTRENVVHLAPAVRYEVGRRFAVHGGPIARYSSTPTDTGTIVATQAPLGVGRFGLVGVRGGLSFDSRQPSVVKVRADVRDTASRLGEDSPVAGVRFEASGFLVPKAWDVNSRYGGLEGGLVSYIGSSRAHVALRAGGRKLWGLYPWFDAAYIGGANNRGFNSHRFAGDASLSGSAALRWWAGHLRNRAAPVRFGFTAFVDTGRVWLAGESSKSWHTSIGGGVLARPVAVPFVVNAILAHSAEGNRFYFGFGYPF